MFFCFDCLRPVSCVHDVASFSGFSILDSPFGFLYLHFITPIIIGALITNFKNSLPVVMIHYPMDGVAMRMAPQCI